MQANSQGSKKEKIQSKHYLFDQKHPTNFSEFGDVFFIRLQKSWENGGFWRWWVFFSHSKGGQRLDLHGPRASPGRNRWMACSNCSANASSAMYLLRTPNKPIKDIRSITWQPTKQNKNWSFGNYWLGLRVGGGNRTRKRERVMMTTLWFFKITRVEKHGETMHFPNCLEGSSSMLHEYMNTWIYEWTYMNIWLYVNLISFIITYISYMSSLHSFQNCWTQHFRLHQGIEGFSRKCIEVNFCDMTPLQQLQDIRRFRPSLLHLNLWRSCGGIHNFFQYTDVRG